MRKYYYIVKFSTGQQENVAAYNEVEAIILAQAEQIKKGNQYKCIEEVYIIE